MITQQNLNNHESGGISGYLGPSRPAFAPGEH